MTNSEIALRNEGMLLKDLVAAYAAESDDPEMAEALANETDLPRMIVATLTEAKEAEAFADALKAVIEDYRARKDRFERKAKRLRSIVAQVMQEAGLKKLAKAEMTVSLREGTPGVITTKDADASLAEFFPALVREKTTYSFDTKAICEALAQGELLPFAHLSNAAPILTIKVK